MITRIMAVAVIIGMSSYISVSSIAGPTEEKKESTVTGELAKSPLEYAAGVEKGKLKNPYTGNEEAIKEGKGLYFSYSCNGCHGGGAGGGMCPPITNEVWIYGSNDDVLFRLISEGSQKLLDAGYKRIRTEKVKGPMPPFGELVENADEMWKIIAWLRTKYKGRKKSIDW